MGVRYSRCIGQGGRVAGYVLWQTEENARPTSREENDIEHVLLGTLRVESCCHFSDNKEKLACGE